MKKVLPIDIGAIQDFTPIPIYHPLIFIIKRFYSLSISTTISNFKWAFNHPYRNPKEYLKHLKTQK